MLAGGDAGASTTTLERSRSTVASSRAHSGRGTTAGVGTDTGGGQSVDEGPPPAHDRRLAAADDDDGTRALFLRSRRRMATKILP